MSLNAPSWLPSQVPRSDLHIPSNGSFMSRLGDPAALWPVALSSDHFFGAELAMGQILKPLSSLSYFYFIFKQKKKKNLSQTTIVIFPKESLFYPTLRDLSSI